ncbi:MAG: hypothetical protein ACRDOB_02065 [Streptosporangiaceae bacterium]
MSLSAREQQALDVIAEEIAGSEPKLASKLATFTRLTAGEDMPVRERILAAAARRPDARDLFRLSRRPGWGGPALLVWLVIAVALVTVALAISTGSQGACTRSRPAAACAGPSPAQLSRSAGHQTTAGSLSGAAW